MRAQGSRGSTSIWVCPSTSRIRERASSSAWRSKTVNRATAAVTAAAAANATISAIHTRDRGPRPLTYRHR